MNIQGLDIPGLRILNWSLAPHQHWGIFVTQSSVSKPLEQLFHRHYSEITELPATIGFVSLSEQQKLHEDEITKDETDFNNFIDYGSTVEELIKDVGCDDDKAEELLERLNLTGLKQRGFRQLSTGETRRVMLARAMASEPDMLFLEEPYAGLDVENRALLKQVLDQLASVCQLVVLASRVEEMPSCLTHIALFDGKSLSQTMTTEEWQTNPVVRQLNALSEQKSEQYVRLINQYGDQPELPSPLLNMNNAKVEYTDGLIFGNLNWTVKEGQHWQIRGPNGCGKSSLLGLITGDHPQCYSNDIQVLGYQRGGGESIWDVKKKIGIVSSSLHLQYRVGCSALDVLLSGFFDSIGLYESPSANQVNIANQWLAVLGMTDYKKDSFTSLEYGQQRLLLIARALIKRPALLILDEPYQGLDYLSRQLIMKVVDKVAQFNLSHLLYVTHHKEDQLSSICHYVDFIPNNGPGFTPVIHHGVES
ncbi:ATP-binding cassette domain-containing protein [Vibrio salinus]|uniref:ATP-binding cassette domain-containing protein n=1 Tax=Vibrio salinus TaxID=2899784 RepID=UPI001E40244C|nr:ATP-binding cassette domain-containing protein [Vibrio salinus]MCE0493938.1 ATP-binding cassette domain-containing protein [Vibrio salinus]